MKYYIFERECDDFSDITKDTNIKKFFKVRIKYNQHLILGSDSVPEDIQSYIMLKYGEDIRNNNNVFLDRTPKPFKDYIPDTRRPVKFKKL